MSGRAGIILGLLWGWSAGMATCRLLDAYEASSHTVVRPRSATPPPATPGRNHA